MKFLTTKFSKGNIICKPEIDLEDRGDGFYKESWGYSKREWFWIFEALWYPLRGPPSPASNLPIYPVAYSHISEFCCCTTSNMLHPKTTARLLS